MTGSLTLHPDGLILENSAGVTTIFSYNKIIGTCVLVGGYLAFQYDLIDYKVSFASGDISAHMWTVAIITASGRSAEDQGLVI